MCEELKPCRVCGGAATLVYDNAIECDEICWQVRHLCKDGKKGRTLYGKPSYMSIKTPYFDSREKAIEAWNAQAERTCHNDTFDDYRIFRCSACNTVVAICICDEEDAIDTIGAHEFRFCPHCGAKVVQE